MDFKVAFEDLVWMEDVNENFMAKRSPDVNALILHLQPAVGLRRLCQNLYVTQSAVYL